MIFAIAPRESDGKCVIDRGESSEESVCVYVCMCVYAEVPTNSSDLATFTSKLLQIRRRKWSAGMPDTQRQIEIGQLFNSQVGIITKTSHEFHEGDEPSLSEWVCRIDNLIEFYDARDYQPTVA